MSNEYITPEVIEVSNVDGVILGNKLPVGTEMGQPTFTDNDLDD